jgi:AcrR family transcriptional regulator
MLNSVQNRPLFSYLKGSPLGVKERQERDREAVSRAILDAARDLFVAEGYEHVSIRKIAERIEYSPAAIYSYFPSKDDIFYALAEEGFRILSGSVVETQGGPDPLEAIRRGFWRVYEFSKSHPEYYALMFVDRTVPRISRDWERFRFVHELQDYAATMIQTAIDAGQLPPSIKPPAAIHVLFAAVHGAALMSLCERMAHGESGDALVRDTLNAALAGLRAGSPVTFEAAHHPGLCDPEPVESRGPES